MVNFTLNHEEIALLKSLIGKKLLYLRHDPLDKFEENTVYGRVEMFFDNCVILVDYDYETFDLYGINVDDHPKFSIKAIGESEAISALQDTDQINVRYDRVIKGITLAEDLSDVNWDDKSNRVHLLKAIIIEFDEDKIAIQGDYMIPLLDIIKGERVEEKLLPPGDEFDNGTRVRYTSKRLFVQL